MGHLSRGCEPLITVGHGTLTQESLAQLLTSAGVEVIVDVRTAPGSRRHPHVARSALAVWLPAAGVEYRWERRLGGFRKPAPNSPNTALRHPSFRGYADHMRTPAFWAALDAVLVEAARRPTAVMCSEAVYWRCHRRLIADASVLARGLAVRHLGHDGRFAEHRLTGGVRLAGDGVPVYDVGETDRLAL